LLASWQVRLGLFLERVQLKPVQLVEGRWVAEAAWYQLSDRTFSPLEAMDAVFMRTDPPVTTPLPLYHILDINSSKPWLSTLLKG